MHALVITEAEPNFLKILIEIVVDGFSTSLWKELWDILCMLNIYFQSADTDSDSGYLINNWMLRVTYAKASTVFCHMRVLKAADQ